MSELSVSFRCFPSLGSYPLAAALTFLLLVPFARAEPDAPAPEGAAPASVAPTIPASDRVRGLIQGVDAVIGGTEFGRRLLAATADTPVLERRDPETPALRYVHARRALVVEPDRLERLPAAALELGLVRERQRASDDVPIALVEDEQRAYQAELQYALEKAAADPDFDARLRAAYAKAEAQDRGLRAERRKMLAAGVEPGPEADLRTPPGAMDRLGTYLYLFSESPDELYWIVERDETPPRASRFAEISDFMELHAGQLEGLRCPASGRYCWLGGRSYPRRLGDAALAVKDAEGLERLREAVGIFQTKEARALTEAVDRWVRGRG